ncbi:MAG: flagellar hook-associated protein FlgK, partial [Candidatus Latescibacterota bacterium]|nr:flagellar hook-associated protein FlgK [Candidatus Latescibacterota bacterium]
MRVQQQILGRWEVLERALGSIEAIFNEPAGAGSSEAGTIFNQSSGLGLSGSFSRFWNAWQDLANVPESGAARAVVRQEADFLVTTMHQYNDKLRNTRSELDADLVDEVADINELLDQLASINAEVPRASFDGGDASDLKDRRDLIIDELSRKVDITLTESENGQLSVLSAGHNLLQGDSVVHLQVRQTVDSGTSVSRIHYADDGSIASISEGRLRGLIQVRDEVVPQLLTNIDEMAVGLVNEVNALHRTGFGQDAGTGVNFFDPEKTDASNIALDDAILASLSNIAASQDGNPGDNGMALALSSLRNGHILAEGTRTMEDFYYEMLGEIGAQSSEAQTMAENHRLFSSQIENRRQSVQGVSLNDEASQLILFQRAYQAAARTVSIIDELLEVTVNI